MTAVHQVVIGASPGDAITSMAIEMRSALRARWESEIFAYHLSADLEPDIRPLRRLPPSGPRDVLIYHASYGEPEVTHALLGRRGRIVLAYHNITPSRFFLGHGATAAALEWGRHELRMLLPRVSVAIADSEFNAEDLRQLGYDDVHVHPAGLRSDRLVDTATDTRLELDLAKRFPSGFALAVSQLLPHKRMDTLVGAAHLWQWVLRNELGLVIVGGAPSMPYRRALEEFVRRLRLPNVWIAGKVSDSRLATLYRSASMYLSASEHEGLAVPPLEAMTFGVPVIARSAGALPETIGDGGIILPADAGPVLFAEAAHELTVNEPLRHHLVSSGSRRVHEMSQRRPTDQLVELVGELV